MAQKLTKSDLEYIKTHFRTRSNRQLAEDLKVDKSTIVHAINNLGLQRTREEDLRLKTGSPDFKAPSPTPLAEAESLQSSNKFHGIVLIILFSLVFLLYADSFKNKLVWDDEILVVQNNYIRDVKHIPQFFTQNAFKGGDRDSNFWRPTQLLSYMTDYKISEWFEKLQTPHKRDLALKISPIYFLNPIYIQNWHPAKDWNSAIGFHISNTLFHALVCVFIYLYIFLIFRRKDLALIASLIYSVHPIHTEAVTYIAGRADSLATLFILASLCLYIKSMDCINNHKKALSYMGSIISFVFALMSKEMAIMLPAYMLLTDLVIWPRQKKKSYPLPGTRKAWPSIILRYLPFLILLGAYLFLRSTVLDFANIPLLKEQPANQIPTFLRFTTFTRSLFGFAKNPDTHFFDLGYFWILLFPFNLHMERSTPYTVHFFPQNAKELPYIFCFVGFLSLLGLTFYSYKKSKPLFFGLAFFLIALIPFMDIMPLNANMAEHWLYIPSIGIFVCIAQWMVSLLRLKSHFSIQDTLKKIIFSPIPIYVIYCSMLTVIRNLDWKDEMTIWKATATLSNSSHIHGNLGVAYGRQGNIDGAKQEFIKALRLQFNYPEAHNNLGVIFMMELQKNRNQNTLMAAKKEFELAIQCNPNYSNAYKNLGDVYAELKNSSEARRFWKKALEINPYQEDAKQRLSQATQ